MRDFTFDTLNRLFSSLKNSGYNFIPVAEAFRDHEGKCLILRHDVDARNKNSLQCADMENRLGIRGTYYFRSVRGSYDEGIIREISHLGHEIGYHYEDLAAARGDYNQAIRLFEQNLAKLRRLVPIETICMHGSPLSKYDNRKLWVKYDYRDFGISGEPYLDIDFREVLYLTDTGRRWDGERYSIRDRVTPAGNESDAGKAEPAMRHPVFRSTFDILDAVTAGVVPSRILLTLHPQRWDDKLLPWLRELIWQNIKNTGKGLITRSAIRR
ncbi:MAG: hypothetical protein P1P83_07000 [Bacteroidales bacterium]|nr:hypothetical protein [Bacteroidales bacterium]MDT8374982.1 hypothetical protein [Bacteroidales bacterium]